MHLRFNFLEATSATSATISASVRSSGSSISLNFGARKQTFNICNPVTCVIKDCVYRY